MLHVFDSLELHIKIMLIFTLILIFIYEAINGFHDASNSVVTVIYTCALRSKFAIALSGIFNFLGVAFSGLSVAYTIIHLLPTQLIINSNTNYILAMVSSMLLAAITWNLFTWYLRLPTSSSHTLIGSLIGIGIINAITTHCPIIQGLNIQKLIEILLSLIITPLISLILAKTIMSLLFTYYTKNKQLYHIHLTPSEQEKKYGKPQPHFLLRVMLIISSAGVSFSHGANDGQKGIGLIMLLLIGVIPTSFMINMHATPYDIERTRFAIKQLHKYYIQHPPNNTFYKQDLQTTYSQYIISPTTDLQITSQTLSNNQQQIQNRHHTIILSNTVKKPYPIHDIKKINDNIPSILHIITRTLSLIENLKTYNQLKPNERSELRYLLLYIIDVTDKTYKSQHISSVTKQHLKQMKQYLSNTIEYAPLWIIITVATSLSLGTIIGWKRIAITIGEKIGQKEMTYAQGLITQLTTAISIGIASYIGMPVSTTHVLSSSMTGSMLIQGYGIQKKTIKNILMSWILTLPISIILSSSLYWIILKIFF